MIVLLITPVLFLLEHGKPSAPTLTKSQRFPAFAVASFNYIKNKLTALSLSVLCVD